MLRQGRGMTKGSFVWAFSEFCEGTFGSGRAWSSGEALGGNTDSRQAFAYCALYRLERWAPQPRFPPLQRQCLLPRPQRAWAALWCRVVQHNHDWCEMVQSSCWGAETQAPLFQHFQSYLNTKALQFFPFTTLLVHIVSRQWSLTWNFCTFFILHHLQEKLE